MFALEGGPQMGSRDAGMRMPSALGEAGWTWPCGAPGLRPLGQKSLSGSPPSKPQGNYRILCVPQGEEGWEALV